jgi:hypothetical protein
MMVENLPAKEELKVVRFEAPGLNASVARKMINFANMARNNDFGDGGVMYSGDNFSTRKVIAWARKTALHRDPIIGAKKSWLDKMPQSEQDAMLRILMTHFGSRRRRASNGIKKLKGNMKVIGAGAKGKKRGRPAKSVMLNGTNG